LKHFQELLRLVWNDEVGCRFLFPLFLITLNRDDDAVCFIRHFYKSFSTRSEVHKAAHLQSREGDWLYGHQDGARYLDILEVRCLVNECTDVSFLVAAALIKMRVVAAREARKQAMIVFASTEGGKRIASVGHLVSDFLAGDSVHEEQQQGHLDHLLDQINALNPNVLPVMLNPSRLTRDDNTASIEEALFFYVAQNAASQLRRIPGAVEMLEASPHVHEQHAS
jgi:hypothetical protein